MGGAKPWSLSEKLLVLSSSDLKFGQNWNNNTLSYGKYYPKFSDL